MALLKIPYFSFKLSHLLCFKVPLKYFVMNGMVRVTNPKALRILEQKVTENPENADNYCHLLGNAWFNLSYYGAAWNGLDYERSYVWGSQEEESRTNFTDLSRARNYYRQSINEAKTDELAALSALMFAKCEVVQSEPYEVPYGIKGYDMLLAEYEGTEAYRKALDECRYFLVYSRR